MLEPEEKAPVNVIRISQEGASKTKELTATRYILLCLDPNNKTVTSNLENSYEVTCNLLDGALGLLGRPAVITAFQTLNREIELLKLNTNALISKVNDLQSSMSKE